jgi:hypothetical protein
MDTVVVIYCSEDGDHSIQQMSRDKFLKRLKDDYKDSKHGPKFFDPSNHDQTDLNTFDGYIVIEGKIVQPKPIEVATEWSL